MVRRLLLEKLVIELERDRIRVRDEDGRIVSRRQTAGAILPDLCRSRAGTAAIPSRGSRIYRVAEPGGDIDDIAFPQVPRGVWIRRQRILVIGRDRALVLSSRPLAKRLDLKSSGRIDPARTRVSWPVAVLVSPRSVNVVNLQAGKRIELDATGAIGATAVHRGRVVVVERDRVVLVDGVELSSLDRLQASQRLREETLVVARNIGALLTRDTVIVADLAAGRLTQVPLPAAARSVRLEKELVRVDTRDGRLFLDRSGRVVS